MNNETLIEETKNLDFPERIKKFISILENKKLSYKFINYKKYKFSLYDCVTMEDVRKFEIYKNIKLPKSFVRFITEVSDGIKITVRRSIIEPYIYELETINIDTLKCNDETTIFDNDNYKELWCSITKKIHESNDDVFLEKQFSILQNGLIFFGSGGCSCDYCLICKGKEYGKIAIYNRDHFPDTYPKIISNNFEEWLEKAFIDIILECN